MSIPVSSNPSSTKPAAARRAMDWLRWGATALVLTTAGFLAADASRAPSVFTPLYRPFITEVTSASSPAWSPDGRTLAYLDVVNGQPQVFVRAVDASQSTAVAREAAASSMLLWAPDGSRLYFMPADGSIASVGAGGGEAQRVEGVAKAGAGDGFVGRAALTPDGQSLVFARGRAGAVQLSTLDTRDLGGAAIDAHRATRGADDRSGDVVFARRPHAGAFREHDGSQPVEGHLANLLA